MLPATVLAKKREGHALSESEIRFFIEGFCSEQIADYQMSALAMAICIRGMTSAEVAALTKAMVDSGDRLPRCSDRPRVDKHSTGGIGDKVSLILAPLLATCGVDVPMISGRGLGLTGGTLDKLESIEGFQTQLTVDESSKVLRKVGAFIVGADSSVAPADKRLYSLRDVTGTVESVALITASILSKKLAARLDALVMDVKVGSGAFMRTMDEANELATSIRRVSEEAGLFTSVIFSDMDQPLGAAIGNAIEVNEAVDVLQGMGPPEVRELTLELCSELLVAAQVAKNREEAITLLDRNLDSGAAMERFERMIVAQGGLPKFPRPIDPESLVSSTSDGWVSKIDCPRIGETIVTLGGGRRLTGDTINSRVGVRIHVRIGERVKRGQPLLSLHCDKNLATAMFESLNNIVEISDCPVSQQAVILTGS